MQKIARNLLIVLALNLAVSTTLYAQAIVTGTAVISACADPCLSLTSPPSINLASTKFIDNSSANIFIGMNYDLGQKLIITDLKNNGGFRLDLTASSLESTASTIPYTDIGIMTWNNSSTESTDGSTPDSTVNALLDKPYNYTDFSNDFSSYNSSSIESEFHYFSGLSAVNSQPLTIVDAPTGTGRFGDYSLALGLIIKIPNNSISTYNLNDGNYNLELTFTLTRI